MKKTFLAFVVLFSAAGLFSACEKCTVCTATVGTEELVGEYCGDAASVADFEKTWVDSLTLLSIPAYCQRGPND